MGNIGLIFGNNVLCGVKRKSVRFVKPIQIRSHELKNFGFEWCNEACGYFNEKHALYNNYTTFQFHPFCTNDRDCWIELEYIHELQNVLYFFNRYGKKKVRQRGVIHACTE